jgi:hypothetical protein
MLIVDDLTRRILLHIIWINISIKAENPVQEKASSENTQAHLKDHS